MSALSEAKQQYGLDLGFLNRIFWKWALDHRELVVYRRKVLIFTLQIRVRDVHPLIEALVGPLPAVMANAQRGDSSIASSQ